MDLHPGDGLGWDEERGQCTGLFELSLLGRITPLGSPRRTVELFFSASLLLVPGKHTYTAKGRNRHSCSPLQIRLSSLLFNFANFSLCLVPKAERFRFQKDFQKNMYMHV